VLECNWYGWLARSIQNPKVEVLVKNMPDPHTARRTIWLPFMKDTLKVDEETIVVGHSSGAAAILRFLETNKVGAAILISAYTSDLGDPNEKASGYFEGPFLWDQIRKNARKIIQFTSSDDPFLPIDEQLAVVQGTQAIHHSFTDRGHFMEPTFPELLAGVNKLLEESSN